MIPTLSSPQIEVIQSAVARFVLMVQIDLDGQTLYLCNADRDVIFDGNEYTAVGSVASMEPIVEKTSAEATGVRMSLSGVPLSMRSLALQEPIRGRECRIYVGLFDEDEQPIGVLLKEFAGTMSAPTITTSPMDEAGNRLATISIDVESDFLSWAKGGRARRHTHEDQKFYYPDDDGYEFADQVSKQIHLWGVPK